MRKPVRTVSITLIVLLLISISVNVVLALDGTQPVPGSDQDPLVSKSYVDLSSAKNDGIIQQLQSEIAALKNTLNQLSQLGTGTEGFKVVELATGQALYTGNGTELVLRSGNAVSINGEYGGLADTTSAKDIASGSTVAANHLIISSRDDGRGIKATVKCYLLVRGAYKIVDAAPGTVTPPATGGEQPAAKTATVNASSLNIRSGPGTENSPVGSAVKGDKVTVLEQSGEWHKIKKADGTTGWVMSRYLTFN